jgi:hypothetical protein
MKRNWTRISVIVLVLLLGYWIWTNWKIDIDSLDNKSSIFSELPPLVADVYRNTKKYEDKGFDSNLISLDSLNTYRFEVSTTGSWTDYYIIVKDQWTKYKVPYGKASPFVIYDNELFIPDRYNVANNKDAEIASYERYRLK